MKVNMTPNPLDVVTIHASQGDSEVRQWEFELHNNGELIDTSGITEQMVFKSYKGGTEQILPENGAVPVTAPFVGDIQYPDATRTGQEFLYRQSPTEEDGNAKITDIKGNTLVWNQLIQNGNFADTSIWSAESGATISISNNIATISSTTANNGIRQYFLKPLTVGHKYLIKAEFNVPTEYRCVIGTASSQGVQTDKLISTANTWTEVSGIGTCTVATTTFYCFVKGTTYENVKIRNVMCFDLTQMGLDITDPSDFTSLFPLSYYSYNQGSLLSFMGNGIKTVGKNQLDKNTVQSSKTINASGQVVSGSHIVSAYIPILPNTNYYLSNVVSARDGRTGFTYDGSLNPISVITISGVSSSTSGFFTTPSNARYMVLSTDTPDICQLEFGTSATSYEPYTSSTLSLPISTYFPNGMNGFNGVYDELTSTKAITRYRRRVFDGTENWTMETFQGKTAFYLGLGDGTYSTWDPLKRYCVCDKYYATPYNAMEVGGRAYGQVAVTGHGTDAEFIADFQNVAEWKTWLSNNPTTFVYEAKAVNEVSFTTASLVTENAEIPLSNNDGVLIGKCTEELSAEPGFHDAKIKLADSDGECYSNKIQFHVERSPQ